ncbi:NmrA-like family protein [Poriferisphaera corsica]|uniref:NmrA-like family protein n=1 Tax=Poriferisphaera corsica TaxID=2528020 RepID=A0A517YQ83_9BACT|nr:SDR family oxidoreductase [Poriferisphaera corsica]QDU32378.1 NmrA-like family protein [Poriferisphaera corsica]
MKILVTGATGYIGGRLVPKLLAAGHQVRILVRDASRISERDWTDQVEIAEGNLFDRESMTQALTGIEAAYYLVHSMWEGKGFETKDREAANLFVSICQEQIEQGANQLTHIVYLGGLQPAPDRQSRLPVVVSRHLQSRAEVGQILRDGLPDLVTEFRAGPVIGSGSASFEMVRYLTERLPVMVAPRWISNPVHPISIRNILDYLVAAVACEPVGIVDVGADRLTFKQMMNIYAKVRGLRRIIIPVPVLTPGLASHWVGLVTPIPNKLARPLIEGVIEPLNLQNNQAEKCFPEITVMKYEEAVRRAIHRIEESDVDTRWSDALNLKDLPAEVAELKDWEGISTEVRRIQVNASAEQIYRVVSSLGGETGWLVWEWAWWIRGALDRAVGGPGLRRGRRDPHRVLPGEAIDFWRVELVEEPRLLRLRAEMKLPGKAWLQWDIKPEDNQTCTLIQTAMFEPKGLLGTLYWYSLYPIHRFIFTDMIEAIAKHAESKTS